MGEELLELVKRAREIEMTPAQLREQRQSFVYGNTHRERSYYPRNGG